MTRISSAHTQSHTHTHHHSPQAPFPFREEALTRVYQIHSLTSGLGREPEEVPTLCRQMGTLTPIVGGVGGDLPATPRCLEGLSPKHFSLPVSQKEKQPGDFNQALL